MSCEWKPGDVALVTSWRGKDQPAFRVERDGSDHVWVVLSHGDTRGLSESEVTEARRVALIDPGPGNIPARDLIACLNEAASRSSGETLSALAWLAGQFEEQIVSRSKPKEPVGLGAVVEDRDGTRWTRVSSGTTCAWVWSLDSSNLEEGEASGCPWDRIDAVRVLSDGVTP